MVRDHGVGAYTKAQVTTSTNQKELIVMAYDGVLRFLSQAKEHLGRREIEPTHVALTKARAILEELAGTLNMDAGGEIARNLWSLYVFFIQKIGEANLTKNLRDVEAIIPSIQELREAWANLEVPLDDVRAQALNRRVAVPEQSHRLSVSG